jgi:mannose-1-phosphate guanylyltransferase
MSSPIDRKKYKRAVIILAGGEGIHLHESTKHVPQHHIPEQFCICTDQDTLLAQTLRAAAWLAPLKATAIVVNRAHREFYNQLTGMPRSSIVAQPSNRGTLLAILWGLRHLQNLERKLS